MSFFTQQFENKPINIASCVPCRIEKGNEILFIDLIVTSYVNSFEEEHIYIYSADQSIDVLHIKKSELLKAIQQTPVYGKVDD